MSLKHRATKVGPHERRLRALHDHIQGEYRRLHAAGVIGNPAVLAEALASGVPVGSLGAELAARRVYEEYARRTGGAPSAGCTRPDPRTPPGRGTGRSSR